MLNPDAIVGATLTSLRAIDALVAALVNDPNRIIQFLYQGGNELPLSKTIYNAPAPSVTILWGGTIGGNFSGRTQWKHFINLYLFANNSPSDVNPVGLGTLWWLIVNGQIGTTGTNIRNAILLDGTIEMVELPKSRPTATEQGLDYIIGSLVFDEIGDN